MANHKSAIKRARQNAKRRLHNRDIKGNLRTELKKFIALVDGGQKDEAQTLLPAIHKVIDKAQSKGVITKNTASRKKSRTTLMLNKALA
ncbi:MAG: 30S ribosomal protein S20 [bacterium]|nr:30S ribosomal protein S20 [bacterium]